MHLYILLVLILASLIGCAGNPQQAATATQNAGPFPESYKEIISQEIKRTFFDPYSLRDTSISTPVAGSLPYQSGSGSGWVVCTEANGKNRMGGYVGLTKTAFLIRNGMIVGAESERFVTADICKTHVFASWDLNAAAPAVDNRHPGKR